MDKTLKSTLPVRTRLDKNTPAAITDFIEVTESAEGFTTALAFMNARLVLCAKPAHTRKEALYAARAILFATIGDISREMTREDGKVKS